MESMQINLVYFFVYLATCLKKVYNSFIQEV